MGGGEDVRACECEDVRVRLSICLIINTILSSWFLIQIRFFLPGSGSGLEKFTDPDPV